MSAPKLLLVEDDTALAELVEYRFRGEGYDVRTTDDGDEALLLGLGFGIGTGTAGHARHHRVAGQTSSRPGRPCGPCAAS